MISVTKRMHSLIVYTDLDGTLIDHEKYSFFDALPALNKLKSLQYPVIPVTSKTLSEVIEIVKKADLTHPVIAENGSVIAFPKDYFSEQDDYTQVGNYWVKQISTSYEDILLILKNIRKETGFNFQGFSDMSVDEIIHHTGLSQGDANKSQQRSGTEPILWLETDKKRNLFEEMLIKKELKLVKGGRFWHVMGNTSKGDAIKIVNQLLLNHGHKQITTMGLGDSPNDISMLEIVDIPVIIPSHEGRYMTFNNSDSCLKSRFPGPKGWNQFVLEYLSTSVKDDLVSGADVTHDTEELKKGRVNHG